MRITTKWGWFWRFFLRCSKEQRLDIVNRFVSPAPPLRPHLVHTNGSFRNGWSRDFFRFAIFLLYTGALAGRYVVAPSQRFNLSKADGGQRGKQKEESLPCSCITPRKVQECLLMRAPSTRLSSQWWEPLRPWSSAVTTPAPSSDISAFGVITTLTAS